MSLPPPVQRWVDALGPSADPGATAVIEGRARFRRGGKGPWLPIEAVMWHELGHNHVVDLRIGLGPLTFIRGLDGYLDGTGFSRISHTLDVGPEIDQASLLFMWSEAILFPAAWMEREDVVWTPLTDDLVAVAFSQPALSDGARLAFDPGSGMPTHFITDRFKGVGGRRTEWRVDYEEWRPTKDGVLLPAAAVAVWGDEPGPWFRMEIERANPGADVSGAMARGRALLAEIADDPTRNPR